MSVINIDDYSDTGCFPFQQDYGLDTSGSNDDLTWDRAVISTITCPRCLGWITGITGYTSFHFCPYCGKELFVKQDMKAEILERLDKMLEEIKAIKKELECSL